MGNPYRDLITHVQWNLCYSLCSMKSDIRVAKNLNQVINIQNISILGNVGFTELISLPPPLQPTAYYALRITQEVPPTYTYTAAQNERGKAEFLFLFLLNNYYFFVCECVGVGVGFLFLLLFFLFIFLWGCNTGTKRNSRM